MDKILQLTPRQPDKFDFERVKKKRKTGGRGQLNLFHATGAQVIKLPTDVGPFDEALLFDERGDKRAKDAYVRAIEEGDSAADAYCNLGIIESKEGRTAKAFDCFTKSLENDARHVESHFNLGNLYFEEGDLRLARIHYELAAEVEPTSLPNLYFNLGLVYAMSDDLGQAIQSLNTYKDLVSPTEAAKADELLDTLQTTLAKQAGKA